MQSYNHTKYICKQNLYSICLMYYLSLLKKMYATFFPQYIEKKKKYIHPYPGGYTESSFFYYFLK